MKKVQKTTKKKPIIYWLIEFTLKSSEVISFYIKAKTYVDAMIRAEEYEYWLENDTLRNKLRTFRLMP